MQNVRIGLVMLIRPTLPIRNFRNGRFLRIKLKFDVMNLTASLRLATMNPMP